MTARPKRVLVTGANGFIGSNLVAQLGIRPGFEILAHTRESSDADLLQMAGNADFVCHLAGVNRPDDASEFARVNTDFTKTLTAAIEASGRKVPVIFASSVHVERNNEYGASKLAAEKILLDYSKATSARVYIFRLSHVIGKWCRPNYNSVVATFCHNIARDLPVRIDDPSYELNVIYIDDLVDNFARIIEGNESCGPYCEAGPSYRITVGELAERLRDFRAGRRSLVIDRVGDGLARALYATYASYVPPSDFTYSIPKHIDPRGVFAEMLKTRDSGQFSFFTAPPGVTRGGHYHHSKTEKFLVVKGSARFRFRNIRSGETHEALTSASEPTIVDTVPGWSHDITNVGDDEMIVMLWANEIFDPARPDTYISPLT